MEIREASASHRNALLEVEKEAFGGEGPVIVELVKNLLADPTAEPLLSLVALDEGRVTGHVLFTKARVEMNEELKVSLLAPLAVRPEKQNSGIGGLLIAEGFKMLAEKGVELVFVLGHPGYYPRHGFKPAAGLGFDAPYPLPEEMADAWMVHEIKTGCADQNSGKVLCADALKAPQYWVE